MKNPVVSATVSVRRRVRFVFLVWIGVLGVATSCRHAPPVLQPYPYPATLETDSTPGTPEVWRSVVSQADLELGPRVLLIERGDDALDWRLNLIRSAQSSIELQTFIWSNDEVGRLLVWELLKAVRQRGVTVRLIVDQMFSAQNLEVVAFLATFDPRLQIEFFHPADHRLAPGFWGTIGAAVRDFSRVNQRMHNKTLVIDRKVAIVGGRNCANAYFDATIGLNFKDRDVLVVGAAAMAVSESFEEYWQAPNTVPAVELVDVSRRIERGDLPHLSTGDHFELFGLFEAHSRRASDPEVIASRLERDLMPAESITFVADPPFKKTTEEVESTINRVLVKTIEEARENVWIQTPYLVLSEDAIELFRSIRTSRPEMRVHVSTNSLAATDSWPTYAASYAQKAIFLRDLGFEVGEFRPIPDDIHDMMDYVTLLDRLPTPAEADGEPSGEFRIDPRLRSIEVPTPAGPRKIGSRINPHLERPPFLCIHQKSLVVDDTTLFVGSYNLDPRSEELNTECGFLISGSPVVVEARRSIERDLEPRNAYRVAAARTLFGSSHVRRWFESVSARAPIDLWPWRSTTSYCLRADAGGDPPRNSDHPEFDQYWEDVGPFPLLGRLSRKRMRARLFKGFGMSLRPLL